MRAYVAVMGRQLRFDAPGAVSLVTNRGTAQTMLYRDDDDRRAFLYLLSGLPSKYDVSVAAFVLMGNHYHLIVQSCAGQLSDAMRHLDGSYARRFNRRHCRQGGLFQGRFHSRHIETEESLQRAGVYLHLKPVRAGLARHPLQYRWSSLREFAGGGSVHSWLEPTLLTNGDGSGYVDRVCASIGEVPEFPGPPEDDGYDWWTDGAASGLEGAEEALRISDRAVADAFGCSIDELYIVAPGRKNVPRTVAMVHASVATGLPTEQIAKRYGLHCSSGVRAARCRLKTLVRSDAWMGGQIQALNLTLDF